MTAFFGRENSSTSTRPPGFSTRTISASALSWWVTLRRPNAMVMRSKLLSANGSASALAMMNSRFFSQPLLVRRSSPIFSIAALMSDDTSRPSISAPASLPRIRLARRRVMSPVPAAKSSTASPGLTPVCQTYQFFQARWMPALMTSFIRSYLPATESKTAPTRPSFSSESMVS